ncbi:hypothetical protein BN2537_7169 [Streptomyces venezuelae]|nr:hypothetical protein BN2537_7169 [Streptomyces venezuelae]
MSRLRFVITFEGRTAEERLWRADLPESITSRNGESCTTGDEPTPAPKPDGPDGPDVILRGYFGPREIPRDAKKVTGGPTGGPADRPPRRAEPAHRVLLKRLCRCNHHGDSRDHPGGGSGGTQRRPCRDREVGEMST